MQKLISSGMLPLIFFLASCNHTQSVSESTGIIQLDENIKFILLSPDSFGDAVMLTQSAEIFFSGEYYELLLYVEITSENLSIVGLLPNGARIFSIIYDGEKIVSEGQGGAQMVVPPENFLADFQLAHWPMPVIKTSFATANSCFDAGECDFTESSDLSRRSLILADEEILTITYTAAESSAGQSAEQRIGLIEFNNFRLNYQLKVSTLEVEYLQ